MVYLERYSTVNFMKIHLFCSRNTSYMNIGLVYTEEINDRMNFPTRWSALQGFSIDKSGLYNLLLHIINIDNVMMLLTGRSSLETLVTADLLGKGSMWYVRKNFHDCYYLSAIIWNWKIVFLFSWKRSIVTK